MADKSPRRALKKSGRSIKEKRADRRAKLDATTQMERLTSGHFAITAPGVDRLFELGGPHRDRPFLLQEGQTAESEGQLEGETDGSSSRIRKA